jgi:hypothetical protein
MIMPLKSFLSEIIASVSIPKGGMHITILLPRSLLSG